MSKKRGKRSVRSISRKHTTKKRSVKVTKRIKKKSKNSKQNKTKVFTGVGFALLIAVILTISMKIITSFMNGSTAEIANTHSVLTSGSVSSSFWYLITIIFFLAVFYMIRKSKTLRRKLSWFGGIGLAFLLSIIFWVIFTLITRTPGERLSVVSIINFFKTNYIFLLTVVIILSLFYLIITWLKNNKKPKKKIKKKKKAKKRLSWFKRFKRTKKKIKPSKKKRKKPKKKKTKKLNWFKKFKINRKSKLKRTKPKKSKSSKKKSSLFKKFFKKKEKVEKNKQEKIKIQTTGTLSIKLGNYETEIDALYNKIIKEKKLSINDAMKSFKVTKELVEEWAKVLEEHKLITLRYPAMGSPLLESIKEKKDE
jgi:hypothetical protein